MSYQDIIGSLIDYDYETKSEVINICNEYGY